CTAKEPAERPQGFGAVIAGLEQIKVELDASTVMIRRAPRVVAAHAPRRGWVAAVLVISAALGMLAASVRPKAPVAVVHAEAPKISPALPKRTTTPTGDMVLVEAGVFLFGQGKDSVSLPAF